MAAPEMPKAYDPKSVEERLYNWWEAQGYFLPRVERDQKPFVISMPPPNITGELHHGHAMFLTLEDLMIRWHRMLGEPTLWVPGTDHAGIATQNVVEKALQKEGMNRHELGRERFVERVWKWKEQYGGIITLQIRRMGASCDWTRERFTLDEGLSRAVREAFVHLYNKGLIYRGPRLINWCPHDESAISDLEVVHEETNGKLYYVKYPLEGLAEGRPEFITVATTRPETILGDTAVAVHPGDERYRALVGRTAILPVLGRRIPIISDDAVDPEFGTGAVKVTPGHDPTDYDIGARHQLPIINIMNKNASINENGGPYAGLDRFAARAKIVEDLAASGLLDHIQDHTMSIGRCERCDTIVEPLVSTQWFVKIAPLAEPAIAAVRNGSVRIVPERFEKIYFDWMENIRDWCISRQLWWGHRIPVWYCEFGHETCALAEPARCAVCGSTNLRQDEDVLDTWFSSALWPFSTLGWPDKTGDLTYFYPTSVMETGYEILFFWVARMMMMSIEFMGKPPFHTVYLHGIMRHKDGTKLSKSDPRPGDNPLEVIADYSADALRFAIVTSSAPGNDTRLDLEKVEHARNFGNKIWNMARFIASNLDHSMPSPEKVPAEEGTRAAPLNLADRWILSRVNQLIESVNANFEKWDFGEAARQIHEFLWSEFADWYIEISKIALGEADSPAAQRTRAILLSTFDQALRLLHPTMPFVTEEVWQTLRRYGIGSGVPALIVAPWLQADPRLVDAHAERDFGLVMDMVRAIRNARVEFNVEAGKRVPAIVSAGEEQALVESQREVIALLARLDADEFRIEAHAARPEQALALVVGRMVIYLPLAGMIDVEKEKARLSGEIDKVRAEITRADNLLGGEFAKRAPKEVVQKTRDQVAANRERLQKLTAQLASLDGRTAEPSTVAEPAAQPRPAARSGVPTREPSRPAVRGPNKKVGAAAKPSPAAKAKHRAPAKRAASKATKKTARGKRKAPRARPTRTKRAVRRKA